MNYPAFEFATSTNSVSALAAPGVLGFLAIAFIGGALFLLMRSMKRNLDSVRSGDFNERVAALAQDETRNEAADEDKPGSQ